MRNVYLQRLPSLATTVDVPHNESVRSPIMSINLKAATRTTSEDKLDSSNNGLDVEMEDVAGHSGSDSDHSYDGRAQGDDSPVLGSPRSQSSSTPPPLSRSSRPSEIPESPSASLSPTNVQQASSGDSDLSSPWKYVAAELVLTQPAVGPESRSLSSTHLSTPPQHALTGTDTSAVNLHSSETIWAAHIGKQVYRLPDPDRVVVFRKMGLKFFSEKFLKANQGKEVQLITAEVLVQAYRIFVLRFFSFAPSAEQTVVLNRVSASVLHESVRQLNVE